MRRTWRWRWRAQCRKAPREVAEEILRRLPGNGLIERAEVAGAGFLNFYLRPDWLYEGLRRIHAEGERFGRSDLGEGRRLQVEFVSANPTGPLSVPHGRGAALGDVVASLLDWVGYQVSRGVLHQRCRGPDGALRAVGRGALPAVARPGGRRAARRLSWRVRARARAAHPRPPREAPWRICRRPSGWRPSPVSGARRCCASSRRRLRNFGVRFDVWYRRPRCTRAARSPR